jgi:hypothetical protein
MDEPKGVSFAQRRISRLAVHLSRDGVGGLVEAVREAMVPAPGAPTEAERVMGLLRERLRAGVGGGLDDALDTTGRPAERDAAGQPLQVTALCGLCSPCPGAHARCAHSRHPVVCPDPSPRTGHREPTA